MKPGILNLLKTHMEETSMHGCKNAVDSRSHPVVRFIWLISVLFLIASMGVVLNLTYVKYASASFKTQNTFSFPSELHFPAVTLCSRHQFDRRKINTSDDLFQYWGSIGELGYLYPVNISDAKWKQVRVTPDYLREVGFSVNESIYQSLYLDEEVHNDFYLAYHMSMLPKTCYTFNMNTTDPQHVPLVATEKSELETYLDIHQDKDAFQPVTSEVQLFIHPPNEPTLPESHFSVLSAGRSYEVKLEQKHYQYLPHPYNSYRNRDCAEPKSQKHLKYFSRYSHSGCLFECLNDLILEICGCVTEFMFPNSSLDYCSVSEREICVRPIIDDGHTRDRFCHCPWPCSEIRYDLTTSSGVYPSTTIIPFLMQLNVTKSKEHARDNLLRINISYRTLMIHTITHVPEVGLADIVSDLGSYMGFFVGASILTAVEIVYLCLLIGKVVVKSTFRRNGAIGQVDHVTETKEKPKAQEKGDNRCVLTSLEEDTK